VNFGIQGHMVNVSLTIYAKFLFQSFHRADTQIVSFLHLMNCHYKSVNVIVIIMT